MGQGAGRTLKMWMAVTSTLGILPCCTLAPLKVPLVWGSRLRLCIWGMGSEMTLHPTLSKEEQDLESLCDML